MKKRSIILILISVLLLAFVFSSCSINDADKDRQSGVPGNSTPSSKEITLVLDGANFTISDSEAFSTSGKTLTLTKAGTYRISGTLTDGQIAVAVDKTKEVTLILDGLTASNSTSGVLYIRSADKVTVELAAGSTNTLTDAEEYVYADSETKPNACLYSGEDLIIRGEGTLIVNGKFNNGIGTKNDLLIKGGTIEVHATNNGIKGNGSVTIENGSITVDGVEDGIKSDNETRAEKGFVLIKGGTVNITCSDDAIQGITSVSIEGGLVTTHAGDKAINCDGLISVADGCLVQE